jgi:DNA-binding FadR family transcriptional regulator
MIGQIEEAILSRKLKPGDRLPAERMLQSKNKIGRGTVREALRALEQKGLIEIKKGARGGAFVKEVSVSQVSEVLSSLIHHRRVSLQHLAEFREIVESNAAAYAVERATPENIAALRELFNEALHLVQSGINYLDEFFLVEMKMHQELARMSSNPLFDWIVSTLTVNMMSYRSLLVDETEPQQMLEDWQEIIEAMENGEVMRARSIIRTHVLGFKRGMEDVADRTSFFKASDTKL